MADIPTSGWPCPPIPSIDPDWPEPTLCQHARCAALRRGGSQPGQPWARTPRGPVPVPPAPIAAMAVWLLEHLSSIRQDEAAAELLADLKVISRELQAAVDNRQYRYAGPCTAVLRPLSVGTTLSGGDTPTLIARAVHGDPGPCGADLKLRVGAHTIVCRDCGAEYDAAERADWIDKESAARLAPGPLIARALTESGYRVKPTTIRKWAYKSRQWESAAVACSVATQAPLCLVDGVLQHERFPIVQAGIGADGLPLYVVGAILTRVRADPALHRSD